MDLEGKREEGRRAGFFLVPAAAVAVAEAAAIAIGQTCVALMAQTRAFPRDARVSLSC